MRASLDRGDQDPVRYVSDTVLFGKSYWWAQDADGKLALRPAPKLLAPKAEEPFAFTWDLARAVLRRPA